MKPFFALFLIACARPPVPTPGPDAPRVAIVTTEASIRDAIATEAPRRGWVPVPPESSADLVLRLDARAEFYAQVAGRYRWDVTTRVEVRERANPPYLREIDTPVFLVYYHEREAAALEAAAPALQRKVGAILEDLRSERRR